MRPVSVELLSAALHAKGYLVYGPEAPEWRLNLVGIRGANPVAGAFDDLLSVFHWRKNRWELHSYDVTTDPGTFYLANPANPRGTAVLKPGQYVDAYVLDIHNRGRRGAHLALCQRAAPVTVFRDANRDDEINVVSGTEDTGFHGINIHKVATARSPLGRNTNVSAGCTVFQDGNQFDQFLLLCQQCDAGRGRKFTYTLLTEADV